MTAGYIFLRPAIEAFCLIAQSRSELAGDSPLSHLCLYCAHDGGATNEAARFLGGSLSAAKPESRQFVSAANAEGLKILSRDPKRPKSRPYQTAKIAQA